MLPVTENLMDSAAAHGLRDKATVGVLRPYPISHFPKPLPSGLKFNSDHYLGPTFPMQCITSRHNR